jgi:hypothetical protein
MNAVIGDVGFSTLISRSLVVSGTFSDVWPEHAYRANVNQSIERHHKKNASGVSPNRDKIN